jgi:hypothetical protein
LPHVEQRSILRSAPSLLAWTLVIRELFPSAVFAFAACAPSPPSHGEPTGGKGDGWGSGNADIVFDATVTAQPVLGVGANIFPRQPAVERLFTDPSADPSGLGMTWSRLWPKVNRSAALDPAASSTDAYTWWGTGLDLATLQDSVGMLRAHGATIIFTINPPFSLMAHPANDSDPQAWSLVRGNESALAQWWCAGLQFMRDHSVLPDFVELYNEPDYKPVHVEPDQNNTIVQALRGCLDQNALGNVAIDGPATTKVGWGPGGDPWILGMDDAGVAALGAWANHGYEWGCQLTGTSADHSRMEACWPEVYASIVDRDPNRTLPIFETEFATVEKTFHGVTYYNDTNHPLPPDVTTVWDTPAYAARVVENVLALLNGGVNVALVWWGADEDPAAGWGQGWGLLHSPARGSTPRPVYYALQSFVPALDRGGFLVVPAAKQAADIYASAFADNSGHLVVTLVNGTDAPSTRTLQIVSAMPVAVESVATFFDGVLGSEDLSPSRDGSFQVTLPSDGVMTLYLTTNDG